MANVNYTLGEVNDGIKGGIKYLNDFGNNNFNPEAFLENLDEYKDFSVVTNITKFLNTDEESCDSFDKIINPGNYYFWVYSEGKKETTGNDFSRTPDSAPYYPSKLSSGLRNSVLFVLIVKKIATRRIQQIAIRVSDSRIYMRRKQDDTWSDWTYYITTDKDNKMSNQLITTSNKGFKIEGNYTNSTNNTTSAHNGGFIVGQQAGHLGLYDDTNSKWIVYSTLDGNIKLNGEANSAITASKLSNARNLKVNLASSSAISFNGTNDATEIGVSGILPMTFGGTGRSWSNYGSTAGENLPAKNAIIKMYNEDKPSRMSSIATANGAFYATETNGVPQFRTLPIAQGGTGSVFSNANNGDIIYYSKENSNSIPELSAISILPIANGGTGTDKRYKSLGVISSSNSSSNIQNANAIKIPDYISIERDSGITLRKYEYLGLKFIRGYLKFKFKPKGTGDNQYNYSTSNDSFYYEENNTGKIQSKKYFDILNIMTKDLDFNEINTDYAFDYIMPLTVHMYDGSYTTIGVQGRIRDSWKSSSETNNQVTYTLNDGYIRLTCDEDLTLNKFYYLYFSGWLQ